MLMTDTDKPGRNHVLLDTNVLISLIKSSSEGLDISRFETLFAQGYAPGICFQNLTELWSVSTRPISSNGLGLSLKVTEELIEEIRANLEWIPDSSETVNIWINMCRHYSISGRRVHDARLAATALAAGVTSIVTFNTADFKVFTELNIIEPAAH